MASDGPDACLLSSEYGLTPDEWQADVLASWLGRTRYGRWSARSCGLLVPRQNGKNGCLEMRELFGLVILGERILHTAHQQKTATKSFRNLAAVFEHRDLARMLDGEPRTALGREGIYLGNGGCIEYIARSRASGRGFTVDLLVLDEAQELSDEHMEALMPTTSAGPLGNSQVILCGTPPNHNAPAEVFGRMRKDALRGADRRLSWHEWSVAEVGDVTDRARWEDTNPALGIRLDATVVESELTLFSEDGFARERLGFWSESMARALVPRADWDALATDSPPDDGRLAYGVKFAPDGSTVSLAVALRPTEGPVHLEVIEHRSLSHGVAWLAAWLAERRGRASVMVIDGLTGASALIEALIGAKVPPRAICAPKAREVVASATMTLNAIVERTITHFGQPALDEAVLNAQRRPIGTGGGWGWGGIGDVDVTPIEAASLAYWGVMTTKRDPTRKLRLL